MAVHPATPARRRSPARSARPRSRPAPASNICSPPRRSNPISIPAAQASTSSAKGLYQFIDQTWLGTMKQDGAGARAGPLCRCDRTPARRPLRGVGSRHARRNSAPAQRSAGERNDGRSAHAQQCGARQFEHRPAAQQQRTLHRAFSRRGWRRKLINGASKSPRASAASMFPHAAAANRSIFYDTSGRARSIGEVYGKLTRRSIQRAMSPWRSAADRWGQPCADFAGAAIAAAGDGRGRASEIVAKRTSDPHRGGGAAAGAACINSDAARIHSTARYGGRHASLRAGRGSCHHLRQPGRLSSRCSRIGSASLWRRPSTTCGALHERIIIADAGSEGVRPVHRHQAQRTQAFGRQGLISAPRAAYA